MTQNSTEAPDLIADIGGTNARFALATPDGHIDAERILRCADYPDLAQAAAAYLREIPGPRPRRAAVAVATPVTGDWIQFTNSPWSFSTEAARQAMGLERLLILNDFTALALALPLLGPDERRAVGGGTAVAEAPIGLIGPGTGLGVSGLVWSGHHWIPLANRGRPRHLLPYQRAGMGDQSNPAAPIRSRLAGTASRRAGMGRSLHRAGRIGWPETRGHNPRRNHPAGLGRNLPALSGGTGTILRGAGHGGG